MNGYPNLQAGLDDLLPRLNAFASLNSINCSWRLTNHFAPAFTPGVSHSSGEILVSGFSNLQAALDNISVRVASLENRSGSLPPILNESEARDAVAGVSHPASEILVDNFSRLDVALNDSFACLDRLERIRQSRLVVDGLCGSSNNSCLAGTVNDNGSDALNFYAWRCEGRNGGNSSSCLAFKRVDGFCGVLRNDCASGFANDSAYADTSTHYRWRCDGTGGGLHSRICSLNRSLRVNGECGSSLNNCSSGVFGTGRFYPGNTKTHYRWRCVGLNDGSNSPVCSLPRSAVGTCGLVRNNCTYGSLIDLTDNSTHYKWQCRGSGGSSPVCLVSSPSCSYHRGNRNGGDSGDGRTQRVIDLGVLGNGVYNISGQWNPNSCIGRYHEYYRRRPRDASKPYYNIPAANIRYRFTLNQSLKYVPRQWSCQLPNASSSYDNENVMPIETQAFLAISLKIKNYSRILYYTTDLAITLRQPTWSLFQSESNTQTESTGFRSDTFRYSCGYPLKSYIHRSRSYYGQTMSSAAMALGNRTSLRVNSSFGYGYGPFGVGYGNPQYRHRGREQDNVTRTYSRERESSSRNHRRYYYEQRYVVTPFGLLTGNITSYELTVGLLEPSEIAEQNFSSVPYTLIIEVGGLGQELSNPDLPMPMHSSWTSIGGYLDCSYRSRTTVRCNCPDGGIGSTTRTCDSRGRWVSGDCRCGASYRLDPVTCGDGVCEGSESCSSCRSDCCDDCSQGDTKEIACSCGGNRVGERLKTCNSGGWSLGACRCSKEPVPIHCGDGRCEGGETVYSCNDDCGCRTGTYCLGNGIMSMSADCRTYRWNSCGLHSYCKGRYCVDR